MKAFLEFELLGTPSILMNEKPIYFSFAKVNALLYYLAINKSVSRDEVAGLLWPDMPDKSAKKNLRNTIYQANKELGAEYILSPNKTNLQLNKELSIRSDVEKFLLDPIKQLDSYRDEFLKGFFLKNAAEFNEWIEEERSFLEQKFIQNCYRKVVANIQENKTTGVVKNIRHLIAIDEYDERNYQLLMQFYQKNHRNGKVIEVYYELSDLLNRDLGIQPNENTQKIYDLTLDLVKKKKEKKNDQSISFFGRSKDIEVLDTHLNNFYKKQSYRSVVVVGDFGVGKTAFCKLVLNRDFPGRIMLESNCFQTEQAVPLCPWQSIFQKLNALIQENHLVVPDKWKDAYEKFSSAYATKEIRYEKKDPIVQFLAQWMDQILKEISKSFRMIFFIEDLQWIDPWSLSLLTSVMIHNNDCMFVLTTRKDNQPRIQDFFYRLKHYNKLDIIEMQAFHKEEIKLIMRENLPYPQFANSSLLEQLYTESEGKPLFLVDYINQLKKGEELEFLSPKVKDELGFLLVDLESRELDVLEVISYFENEVSFSLIREVLGDTEQKILAAITSLEIKLILEESVSSKVLSFQFFHNKLKQYIYQKQPLTQRRMNHEKIAKVLESRLKISTNKEQLYFMIADQYKKAGKELKSLDFELSYLQSTLRFQHELFPVFDEFSYYETSFIHPPMKEEMSGFQLIENRLTKLEKSYGQTEEYHFLLMKFLYLQGRYFINHDDYQRGISSIQHVISKANEYHNDKYLIRGYRQMIYYSIQTDNALEMEHYTQLAMNVAIKSNDYESIGILLRLQGLQNLMVGLLSDAKRLFHESITTMTISAEMKDRYVSNIAASYDYLAEIERLEKDYHQSVFYQNEAIKLCEETKFITSLAVFYVNMGVTLFIKQDFIQSEKYLQKADGLYEKLTSPWKKVEKDVFLTLIQLQKGNEKEVVRLLNRCNNYFSQLINSRDKGMIYFLNAVIKRMLDQRILNDSEFDRLLDKDQEFYYKKAIENLSPYRDCYELESLNEIYQLGV